MKIRIAHQLAQSSVLMQAVCCMLRLVSLRLKLPVSWCLVDEPTLARLAGPKLRLSGCCRPLVRLQHTTATQDAREIIYGFLWRATL
jgi:hypothetical protein